MTPVCRSLSRSLGGNRHHYALGRASMRPIQQHKQPQQRQSISTLCSGFQIKNGSAAPIASGRPSLISKRLQVPKQQRQSTRGMATWPKIRPVRLKVITMDVTGTIVSFRGSLEDHYLGAAEKSGVEHHLDPAKISSAFNHAYNDCCRQYPCFGSDEMTAKEWWKHCVAKSFEIAGVDMDQHTKEVVFQRIYSTFGSHAAYESFADAIPFLQWAKRSGLVSGVLSNADERYGDSILPMLGITLDELQFTCFSKDHGLEKPDPRFFQAAIKSSVPCLLALHGSSHYRGQSHVKNRTGSFGVSLDTDSICLPSEVLHIGNDFQKDFEGARRAGMHCLLLDRYGEEEKAAEWRRRGAPVVKDLMDVVEFLGRCDCRFG